MNVKELICFTGEKNGSGVLSVLDIELLLSYVLGVSREELFTHSDRELLDFELDLFNKYIARLVAGEPIAYISGQKEFYGLDFYVDNRVLVPRPESELIVDRSLEYLRNCFDRTGKKKFTILDIGTGSGNIIIAIVKSAMDLGLDVRGKALDVSYEALDVVKLNIEQHLLDIQIVCFQSDLLEILDVREEFDLITANLPYIGELANRFVEDKVLKHEPNIALFGGKDGLALYERLFSQILEKQIKFGLLMGEFGFSQSADLVRLLNVNFRLSEFALIKDFAGIDRVFVVKGMV